MGTEFAPKDAETLKAEITADLGVDYEGNEEMVNKLVERGLKDEQFKASLHADKKKHLDAKRQKEELLKKAGIDPETGEKIGSNESAEVKKTQDMSAEDFLALTENKVPSRHLSEVREHAKSLGKSIAETLETPYMKFRLNQLAEEERSAAVASVQTKRGGQKENGTDELLTNFKKGVVSENPEDIAKLVEAEYAEKMKRIKRN